MATHVDALAEPNSELSPLRTVESDEVEPVILGSGRKGEGYELRCARDLDPVARLQRECGDALVAQAGHRLTDILQPMVTDDQPYYGPVICHLRGMRDAQRMVYRKFRAELDALLICRRRAMVQKRAASRRDLPPAWRRRLWRGAPFRFMVLP